MTGIQETHYIVRDSHGTMKAKLPRYLAVQIVAADQGRWEDEKNATGRCIRVTTPSVIPIPMGNAEIRLYLWPDDKLVVEED